MKRFAFILFAVLLCLALSSCRQQPATGTVPASPTASASGSSSKNTQEHSDTAPAETPSEAVPTAATDAGQTAASRPSPSTNAPASAGTGIQTEELWCENAGKKIYGKMYRPAAGDAFPCVILSHSYAMTCESMNTYAAFFAEQGYAAYCFDFCGGSSNSKSDGSMADMTVFTEVSDLNAVIDEMQRLPYTDNSRLYLFGTSQGGLVSALAANERPQEIRGLILLYPGFSIAEQVNSFAGSGLSLPESMTTPFGSVGKTYIESLIGFDVYAHIAAFTREVLIIHGTADFIVPIKYSEKAVQIYENAQLQTIRGASHGFNAENYYFFKNYDEEVESYILDFLEKST